MKAYVILDVEIDDPIRYQEYRELLWHSVGEAGGKYLACDGAFKVHEGDWRPRDIVLLEFPSVAAWNGFYHGPAYQGLKEIHDACSATRIACVEGLRETERFDMRQFANVPA